jgi:hypothetical protein
VACATASKSALLASGLPETLDEQCKLSAVIPLLGQRCNNLTIVPSEYQQMADAVCAPGKCNKGADCTDVSKQIIRELAGPYADQATSLSAGSSFSSASCVSGMVLRVLLNLPIVTGIFHPLWKSITCPQRGQALDMDTPHD